ncbi:MAG: Asp-tRNA(Asn)/Glu-tRNA(Gln) amidotransferase subunit GatC [Nitrospirae bacterium]|nr:Asp-tRNA(Asn)/Glu-tRNA(Gln) amidotransferase subunit GatC [Nitrospirota bacterium]
MIDKKQVKHIARLSRLWLSDKEIETFGSQLSGILKYMDKLKELDTLDIVPTSHVIALSNVMREDKEAPSLKTEDALENAPDRKECLYRVPKIIE